MSVPDENRCFLKILVPVYIFFEDYNAMDLSSGCTLELPGVLLNKH